MRNRIVGACVAVSLVVAAVVAAPPQKAAAAPARAPYYVSLGDSLAQGVQPNASGQSVPTDQGYVDDLYAIEAKKIPGLQLEKLGCPGETTTTMINGGICSYTTGNQLGDAVAFIATHRVALVTIDIGANNVDGCVVDGTVNLACIEAGLQAAGHDLPIILGSIRAVDPKVRIVGMNYYDPFLAAYLTGAQTLAKASVALAKEFNGILGTIYDAFSVRVAKVSEDFHTANFTPTAPLGIPLNVNLICTYTWMCAPAPQGPNIHANAAGYLLIANAFEDLL